MFASGLLRINFDETSPEYTTSFGNDYADGCEVDLLIEETSPSKQLHLKVVSIECPDKDKVYKLVGISMENGRAKTRSTTDLIYFNQDEKLLNKKLDIKFLDDRKVLVSQGQGLVFPPGDYEDFEILIDGVNN